MADFEPLWSGGPLFCQAEHFRLSTDCVLLADFVNTASALKGIDLGCASGAISLFHAAVDGCVERLNAAIADTDPAGLRLIHAAACAQWLQLLEALPKT